jgi:formylglycine-generating enzyme required for sulfatase activity
MLVRASLIVVAVAMLSQSILTTGLAQTDMGKQTDKAEKTITCSIGMKLVLRPKGKFKMGSPAEEKGRQAEEHQQE